MAERRHIVPDVAFPVLGAGIGRIPLLRTGGSRHFGLIVVRMFLRAGGSETARCQDDEKTKKRTNLFTFHHFDPPMFYCSALGRHRVKFYHKMNGLSRPIILENAQKKGARRRRKYSGRSEEEPEFEAHLPARNVLIGIGTEVQPDEREALP